jgi:hypothetical protein
VARGSCHKDLSLGQEGPYFYRNLSTTMVDNHLQGKNLGAQRSTHQHCQGKTESYHENKVLGLLTAYLALYILL